MNKNEYEDLRYELIKLVEEGGHENFDLYSDSVGLVSTGVGFNLHVSSVLKAVLEEGFAVSKQKSEIYASKLSLTIASLKDEKNVAKIQKVMNEKWAEITESDSKFIIADDVDGNTAKEKIRAIFDSLAAGFEKTLETRLKEYGVTKYSGENYSNERLALISLEYNNGNGIIKNGLKTALKNGDRFEAWYQIRYYSNGGKSASVGIAKRRYLESEIFGLFESDSPNDAEAKKVINLFTEKTHFDRIQAYEKKYGAGAGLANRDYKSILDGSLGVSKVLSAGEVFKPIQNYLIKRYGVTSDLDLSKEGLSIDGEVLLGIENSNGYVASSVKGESGKDKGDQGKRMNIF